jgi:protein ImuA
MPAALLDLFGDPLRPPTRRERHRVATLRRPSPAPAPRPVPPLLAPPPTQPPPAAALPWRAAPVAAPLEPSRLDPGLLALHPQLWRSSELGQTVGHCPSSGFARLDAELPGGGWPTRAVTELLLTQPGCEWRLLAPGLAPLTQDGRRLLLINPPHAPHPRGLAAWGLGPASLLWLAANAPYQALWALEQALKADADEIAALLAWLPGLRTPQLRRLQTLAARCRAPVFLLHAGLAGQATAAPLRLQIAPGRQWDQLELRLLKRRGPPPQQPLLLLQAPPPTLQAVLPLPEAPPASTALPAALRELLGV